VGEVAPHTERVNAARPRSCHGFERQRASTKRGSALTSEVPEVEKPPAQLTNARIVLLGDTEMRALQCGKFRAPLPIRVALLFMRCSLRCCGGPHRRRILSNLRPRARTKAYSNV
jgi:hypothetical protein